jgi:hypothetical protein
MKPWPDRPGEDTPAALGFTRRPMVDWLSPRQLAATGLRAAMSEVFGSYADKRELEAVMAVTVDRHDYSHHPELWFDYVADLGDGFDATYAVAWLLSRTHLAVPGAGRPLPRGRFLVMGGDQVYPAASHESYRDRLVGPYRAALPYVAVDPPHLFAIPGNHDWYDGLTSFLRLFCQGHAAGRHRWIGGREIRQKRSYFAIELPAGWWLWGIDVQLGSDFDRPQIDYFEAVAAHALERDRPGGAPPRVVLVTGQPTWVHSGEGAPAGGGGRTLPPGDEFAKLAFFEEQLVRGRGLRLAAVVSGDLHHYCRYEEEEPVAAAPTQRITCGGGGAYLYGTHTMPPRLRVEERDGQVVRKAAYALRRRFPDAGTSRRLAWGVMRLPWRSPGFAALVGGCYLLFAWLLQSASFGAAGTLTSQLRPWPGLTTALASLGLVMLYSPASIFFALAVVAGIFASSHAQRRGSHPGTSALGLAHGLAHLALALVLYGAVGYAVEAAALGNLLGATLFSATMLAAGSLAGGWLTAAYLLVASHLTCAHTNEVFAAQRSPDFKSFLRFHVGADGALTIYPIGLRRVPRRWRLVPEGPPGDPWFRSADGDPAPELVEGPVTVR